MTSLRYTLVAVYCLPLVAAMHGSGVALGVEPHTAHTFRLAEGESHPSATLEDVAWLAGSWAGTAFGQRFEEVWTAPSAGSMAGLFKLFDGATVQFYEIMTLTADGGTLSLKVKHFDADFTAWEDKADFVDFRLVKLEPDAIHFAGLSFYRRGPDRIDAYLVLRNDDAVTEHELVYTRVAQ